MRFIIQLGLSFQPSMGYGDLIKNCRNGSIGILWLMAAVSCAVYAISSSMVVNRMIQPVYKATQHMPLISIKDGQLSMPNTTRRFVKQNSTWMLVLDPTGNTTMKQLPSYRHVILLTEDRVYIRPLTLTPLDIIDEPPMGWMDGATKQDFAEKLRSSVHSFTMELSLTIFWMLLISKSVTAAILAGVLSIIHVHSKHRAYNQSWLIATHAQIPAVAVECVLVMMTALLFDVGQYVSTNTFLGSPLYYMITIAISLWSHFKTPLDVRPA